MCFPSHLPTEYPIYWGVGMGGNFSPVRPDFAPIVRELVMQHQSVPSLKDLKGKATKKFRAVPSRSQPIHLRPQ